MWLLFLCIADFTYFKFYPFVKSAMWKLNSFLFGAEGERFHEAIAPSNIKYYKEKTKVEKIELTRSEKFEPFPDNYLVTGLKNHYGRVFSTFIVFRNLDFVADIKEEPASQRCVIRKGSKS